MSDTACSVADESNKVPAQNRVLSNTVNSLVVRCSIIALRLIVLLLIARNCRPDEFGLVAFCLSIAEVAKVFADFGIDTLSIRNFAVAKIDKAKLTYNLLAIKLLSCALVYTFLLIYYAVSENGKFLRFGALLSLLAVTSTLNNLPMSYYQANLRMGELIKTVVTVCGVAILIAAISMKLFAGSIVPLVVLPASELTILALLLPPMLFEVGVRRGLVSWRYMGSLARGSVPIGLTAMLVVIYTRVDVMALKRFADYAAVGNYSVAFRLTEPFQFVAGAFALSVYSHISAALADSNVDTRQTVRKYLSWSLLYGVLSALVIMLLFPIIIENYYPKYTGAVAIAQVLALALVFRALNTSLTAVIQAHGYFSRITVVAVWNLFLASAFLVVLTPKYGSQGAAASLLVAELVNSGIQYVMLKRIKNR